MKRYLAALLALCLLALAGCAKENTPAPGDQPDTPAIAPAVTTPEASSEKIISLDGIELPVPTEYVELLSVETELEAWNEHWQPLVSISEKASLDAFAQDHPGEDWGVGWLCSVSRLDRVGFEAWASGDSTGGRLFARSGKDAYYLLSFPTDVRYYRSDNTEGAQDMDRWRALNGWVEELPDRLVARNGLEAYNAAELFEYDYTYGGDHIELGCRFPGQSMDLLILSLSQPVRPGEGGVWCVERVRYVYSAYDWTVQQLVFPVAFGVDEAAADYYARLQAECDAGEHPNLLTPRGAALDYAKRTAWRFGEDVSESDFEEIKTLG